MEDPTQQEVLVPEIPEEGPPGDGALEAVNLVERLTGQKFGDEGGEQEGDDLLETWGKITCSDLKADFESNRGYYDKIARDIELFLGEQDTFAYGPAEGKPRPCMPVVNKAVTRIYNRMAAVVTKLLPVVVPTGPEDEDRARRLTKHIAWERRAKHPEWRSTMSASMLVMIITGSSIRKVGWDPIRKRKDISWMPPTDCVVAFTEKDTTPHMEKARRVTCRTRWTRQELEEAEAAGFFLGITELFAKDAEKKPSPIAESEEDDDPVRKLRMDSEKTEEPSGGDDTFDEKKNGNPLYMVLERHCWMRLPAGVAPDEATEGNRMRRMCIWVERSTKKVLRAVIMEAEDPIDRLRYKNEFQANVLEFKNRAAQFQADIAAQQAQAEAAAMGEVDPSIPLPMVGEEAEPPVAPEFIEPNPIRKIPVFSLIHYRFMESPIGFYGLGAGVFASQMNILANEAISWHLIETQLRSIAATSGVLAAEFKQNAKKGIWEMDWGKWKQTDIPADVLERSMKAFPINGSGSNLPQLMKAFETEAELQMNAHEALSGAPGPSHETAAAAKMRNARAGENINMAMENIFEPLAAEFKAYARLNAIWLDNEEYFYVVEHDPAHPKKKVSNRVTVGRRDYEQDFDITFDSDVRLEMDEGLGQQALQAYMLVMKSPFADPNTKLEAEKKALRALGQDELLLRYPDEVPPPKPPEPMSQESENAEFVREKDHPVLQDDDDVVHLNKMQEFKDIGMYAQLSPTGKQIFDKHERAHNAQAYLKAEKARAETEQIRRGMMQEDTSFGAAAKFVRS